MSLLLYKLKNVISQINRLTLKILDFTFEVLNKKKVNKIK